MTSTLTPSPPAAPPAPPRSSVVETATALWSVLAVAVGAWLLVDPGWYPLGPSDMDADFSLLTSVAPRAVALATVVLGLLGIGTALAMASATSSRPLGRVLAAVGVAETLVFLAVVPDIRVLILMGYLCALLGPFVVLGVLAAGARRNPRNLVVLAVVVGAVAAGLAATGAGAAAFAELGRGLRDGFAEAAPGLLVVGGAFAGGLLWLASTVRQLRRLRRQCGACGRPARSRLLADPARWGRWVTIGAALCPLPYALLRMTWLTPWPVMMDPEVLAAHPGMRTFGLSLGFAALGGSVLTIGLVSRWGEVFPRWVPVLRGRDVPAGPPTAVALVVAAAVTLAGRSIVQAVAAGKASVGELGAEALLIFPFPVWGPLLGAAAVAYHLRRRGRCGRCGQA